MNPITHPDKRRADTATESATSAYANCKLWRNRLLQRPDDPNTLCGLAGALLASGQREEAEFTVRTALAQEPDMPDAHYVLGKLLHQRGSHVAAVAQYRHALTFGANTSDIWNDLGCSLTSMGNLAAAQEAFSTAIRLSPQNARAHNYYGESLWAQGHTRDAMQSFAAALRLDPTLSSACLNLGTGLVALNRAATAVPLLKRCIVREPDSSAAHLQLGIALQQLGHHAQAIQCFERAVSLSPSVPGLRGMGASLAATGQFVASVDAYREAVKLAPDESALLDEFAMSLLAAGMADQALDISRRRLALEPVGSTALAARCVALARAGDSSLHDLMDFDQLIHGGTISVPPGYGSLSEFNAVISQYITAHPTLTKRANQPETQHFTPLEATTGMNDCLQTGPLLVSAVQPVAELARQLNSAVRGYLHLTENLRGHPWFASPPRNWRLAAWGIVVESRNQQRQHIRPAAWLSAVYFAGLPPAVTQGQDSQGCLRLGGAPPLIDPEQQVPHRVIRPSEGQLLIFPSYLFRYFEAFASTQSHVSIAFDIARCN